MLRKILLSSFLAGLLLAAAYLSYAYLWWPLTLREGQLLQVELKQHLFAPAKARLRVEVVKTLPSITIGLSGRVALVDRQGQSIDGLLFVFPDRDRRHFWMKEMRFAIDICWLSRQQLLVCDRALPPATDVSLTELPVYSSPSAVEMVLETEVGTLRQLEGARLFPMW